MSNPNNPNPSSTDPYHGRSEDDKAAIDALILLRQGPAQAQAQASSSDKGKGVADPNLSERDPDQYQIGPYVGEPDDDAEGDEQQAGPSSSLLCEICGKSLDKIKGGLICSSCVSKERRLRLIAEGKCVDCQKPTVDGKTRCVECRLKDTMLHANDKQKREEAKEAGLCYKCRKRPADPGYLSCTGCREKITLYRSRNKEKQAEEQ